MAGTEMKHLSESLPDPFMNKTTRLDALMDKRLQWESSVYNTTELTNVVF